MLKYSEWYALQKLKAKEMADGKLEKVYKLLLARSSDLHRINEQSEAAFDAMDRNSDLLGIVSEERKSRRQTCS